MQQSARPGDVLADRYLLVDLLTESGNGRFWRAHDQVLERHVALHCLADDDPLADAMTEAARVSATILDRRLLRVLDADRRDGVAYVVNEWGAGTSLDILLASEGPMSPRRAAWVVAEVAAAMAVAHEQRVAHGRLTPENVLIDQTGQVRIIGFCVDAALLGTPPGQVSRDVEDLGGLLYFLLTGRWAGASESDTPPAMREHGRWLRPRQVRAGIPRLLDTVCDQVLNPFDAHEPGHSGVNVHTARGLAELLGEYVGDPSGLIQPAPLNGVLGAGVLAVPERRPPARPEADSEPTAVVPTPEPEDDPEPTLVVDAPRPAIPPLPAPEADAAPPPTLGPPEEIEEQSPVSTPASPVDMPTQAGMPIFDDAADDVSWLEKRTEPPPPPPAFEDPPERPLFAPDPGDGGPARRPRPGAAAPVTGEYWPWDTSATGTGSGVMPVIEPEPGAPEDDAVPGRSWFRLALLIALSLLLLVAVVIAFNLGRGRTPLGAEPEPEGPTRSPSESASLTPIEGTTATDLDPQGDPPEENPDLAPLAVDGDAATAWRTETYFDQLGPPPGLKTGVGLVVDLGESQEIAQIDLTTIGAPTGVTYFLSDEPVKGQYLVVWLTSLPATEGGFRGQIAEVVVRG